MVKSQLLNGIRSFGNGKYLILLAYPPLPIELGRAGSQPVGGNDSTAEERQGHGGEVVVVQSQFLLGRMFPK